MTSLRDRVEYLGYRVISALIHRAPVAPMQALGAFLGRCVYRIGGKHVRWALANARIAYPERSEAERRRMVARSYASFGRNAVDFIRAEHWDDEELRRHVSVVGVEHVEEALERGKGAFYVSAHLGNFELGVRAFASLGTPTLVIGRPMRNRLLYARLERSRTANGQVELVERDQAALAMMRATRRNHGIGVLVDQYVRKSRGIFVPLFGVRCSTTPAVATIALRTGATVLCATVHRDGPDHHEVEFGPVEYDAEADDPVEALTAACNRVIEERIRAHPEQWLWAHRRFRYSPDLDYDPYAA